MSKLDNILENNHCAACDGFDSGGFDSSARLDDNEAITQVKALFLELIGEDDYTGLEQPDTKFWAHTGRNDLRAELRQKVEEEL